MNQTELATKSETALVAAALVDASIIDTVDTDSSTFLDRDLGQFWGVLRNMRAAGKPFDASSIVAIASHAPSRQNASTSLLEALGGVPAVGRLVHDGVPCHAVYYAGEIARWHSVRRLRARLKDAIGRLDENDPDVAAIANSLDAVLQSASISHEETEYSFGQMAELALADSTDHRKQSSVVESGFLLLDQITGGLFPGELTIVGARPSIGKSAFGLGIALYAAKAGKRVALISCEMNQVQLGHRLLAMETGVSMQRMRAGTLTDQDRQLIEAALPTVRKVTGRAWIASRPTVEQIRARAKIAKASGGLDLLVVDYLGLMGSENPKASIYERVTEISKGLKSVAVELDVPLLCLAQLNREAGKSDEPPRLEHLRDSGSIEQDADNVMFIHRQRGSAATTIVMAKQRQGAVGSFEMKFNEDRCSFEDHAQQFGSDFR